MVTHRKMKDRKKEKQIIHTKKNETTEKQFT